MHWQQPIPKEYMQVPHAELLARIAQRKAEMGRRLVILGHHYQQDDVVRFADFLGDSFQLSREAAKLSEAESELFPDAAHPRVTHHAIATNPGPHHFLLPDVPYFPPMPSWMVQ